MHYFQASILSPLSNLEIWLNTNITADFGMIAAHRAFAEFGWLFRPLPMHDQGIDAEVEVCTEGHGQATGQIIKLQVKTGPSYLRQQGDDYVYYSQNMRHLEYWTNLTRWLPVVLIFHDHTTGVTLWRKFEANEVELTVAGWQIEIRATDILNADAKTRFEQIIAAKEAEIQRVLDVTRETPPPSNNGALEDALEGFAQEDRDIRRRFLGYTLWFAPDANKIELYELLERFHPRAAIENNAQRLCEAGMLHDTGNHYLPNLTQDEKRQACQQAMASVQSEIMELIAGPAQ